VGKAIGGVEIRIRPDGEVLLRGENITPGYSAKARFVMKKAGCIQATSGNSMADKRLKILGRKKESRSSDGLKRVSRRCERVLNALDGVRESVSS